MVATLRARPARRGRAVGPVGLCALLLLTGCAGSERVDAARSSAEAFERALAAGDGAAACHLLAPDTAQEVAQSAGTSCASGILHEGLPKAGAVRASTAWGRSAQVRLASDTLFLSHFADGWRVLAAGCSPQPGKPYDCTVQGG
jgi:hypothetical protein